MKDQLRASVCNILAVAISGLCIVGCSNGRNVGVTNMEQPGPVIGRAIGGGVGAVTGNAAGAGVGAVEGFSGGVN